MTKDQVKQVLDRVLTWPPERQEDAAQLLLEEGLAQAKRGEAVPADEIAALLRPGGQ